MDKTKYTILQNSINIFNSKGVADVSLRFIAKQTGISHSNLIYHFKSKSEIIQGIHKLLFKKAIEINQEIDRMNFDISKLNSTTKNGFKVVYEFRFLFKELLYIVKTDPTMLETIRNIELTRANMYQEVIELSIEKGLMKRESYSGEYANLITRIRIYSDHWITTAAIYDGLDKKPDFNKYTNLFMDHFYPYLTKRGRNSIERNN